MKSEPAIMENFVKGYPKRSYAKGEIILQQADIPTCAYVVKSGFVKVYNLTAEGEERPVLFDVTYEIFPIGWVFHKIAASYYFYGAFTDCELYMVPRHDYIEFLNSNPSAMFRALDYYVERHIGQQLRVHALEQSRAYDKLLYTLEFLTRRFGVSCPGNRKEISLPLTQQDIANFIGLTRETVAIELNKLKRDKVVAYQNQIYSVDMSLLEKILQER